MSDDAKIDPNVKRVLDIIAPEPPTRDVHKGDGVWHTIDTKTGRVLRSWNDHGHTPGIGMDGDE